MNLAQTLTPNKDCCQLYFLRSNNTKIEIVSNDKHIWLLLDDVVQTAIERCPPYRPILPHCLIMLLPLLHHKEPDTVLELGGGGQSFQRYLKQTHPTISFTSIELNPDVNRAVKANFPASDNLNVIQGDAFDYLQHYISQGRTFDWLIVDLFIGAHSPIEAAEARHFNHMFRCIKHQGWLLLNCLKPDLKWLRKICQQLENIFNAQPYLFAVPQMQNHVILIPKGGKECLPNEIAQHSLYKAAD